MIKPIVQKTLVRSRLESDERIIIVSLTRKGVELKKKALKVPPPIFEKMDLKVKEIIELQKNLESAT